MVLATAIRRGMHWGYWVGGILFSLWAAWMATAGQRVWYVAFSTPWAAAISSSAPPMVNGVIVDLAISTQTPYVQVITTANEEVSLKLAPYATNVIHDGAVLNLTHLKRGQFISASSILKGGKPVARTIEIVKTPQQMEPGPARLVMH